MNSTVGIGVIKTATASFEAELRSFAPVRDNDTMTNPVSNYFLKSSFKAKRR